MEISSAVIEDTAADDMGAAGVKLPGRLRIGCGGARRAQAGARRAQAMDAAERVFLDHGFHGTTMAEVARSAGMSKKTIYQAFASKDELLEAVLTRRLEALTSPLDAADDDRPPVEVLRRLLGQILRFVLSPQELAFTRLLIADSMHAERVVNVLCGKGLFMGRTTLAQWLARQAENGVLRIGAPGAAAEMLVGMALGELHVRLLLKTIVAPSEEEIDRRVSDAVDLFLVGAGRRGVLF